MRMTVKLAIFGAMMALGVAPALAAGPPSGTPSTPGPSASIPAKAKAYGKYCQGQSKQHVSGQPGTDFSKCVTDMAKAAHGKSKNPEAACANMSREHVAGQQGTPFSRCVSSAAKLLRQQHSG